MNLIVAVDEQWNIGCQGGLLVRIPEDMKRFRAMTLGKIVVMGRKTLESLPHGKPLSDRTNVVLTTNKGISNDGLIVSYSISDLFGHLRSFRPEDIFIIGGAEIYNALIPYCQTGYITKLDRVFEEADTRMTNLDTEKNWSVICEQGPYEYHGLRFRYCTYHNHLVKSFPET